MRAGEPLFDSAWLRPDACVCAIGSSKPTTREVDAELVARAAVVAVEWREQSLREAGDLVLAGDRLDRARVRELGELMVQGFDASPGRGLRLFKSVGIGLEDVALAHLAFRKLHGHA